MQDQAQSQALQQSRPPVEPGVDADGAFRAAHGEALALLAEKVRIACEGESEWPLCVRAAVAAALDFAAAEPGRAHLISVELLVAGPRTAYCHDLLVERFAPALRRGRDAAGAELPSIQEEVLLGGMAAIVAARLTRGDAASLPALAPQLAKFALAPYLGAEEARRVATGRR